MRSLLVAVLVLTLPLVGQTQQAQSGVTAEGWEARLDRGEEGVDDLSFHTMGTGVHVEAGGAGGAIFWQAGSMQAGEYTISATFTQTEPSNHPNAYGLFLGGSDLSEMDQQYAYFVIREDGKFLLRQRVGSETPILVEWTDNAAINVLDADGRATNRLAVEVGANQVRFLVNDQEVSSQPRSAISTDGTAGLRVNHFLNLHIDDLSLGS